MGWFIQWGHEFTEEDGRTTDCSWIVDLTEPAVSITGGGARVKSCSPTVCISCFKFSISLLKSVDISFKKKEILKL